VKRKHRHELKQNEFLVWIDQAVVWYSENKRHIVTGASVVLAGVLVVSGVTYYRGSRQEAAQNSLNEALKLYHTEVREDSAVQAVSGPEFKSHEDRYRQSLAAFETVMEDYSGLDQGRQARYYAALCQKGLERYNEAQQLLDDVTGSRRDLLYYLASRVKAVVKMDRGDFEGAAEIYRLLVDDPNTPLPKDHLLFDLARSKEQAGNLEEAQLNYQRVLEEFPDSTLRSEATQRNELIEYRLTG
jgi:tetratricopeptide (TPR) repeat protein